VIYKYVLKGNTAKYTIEEMKENYLVSIVVPVYNEEDKICQCISSLLDQTYRREGYEVIIVDNGSSDRTRRRAMKYPVEVVSETETQSSYAARNCGIIESSGSIIAFTDADCRASYKWLEKGVGTIKRNKKIGAVAGRIDNGEGKTITQRYLNRINWLSQKATINHKYLPYPQTANAIYKKDVFDKVGLFEEKWISGGDADMSWRMQSETEYKIVYEEEAVIEHNHRESIKSLWGQAKKWGTGKYVLENKYKIPKEKSGKKVFFEILKKTSYYVYNKTKEMLRVNESEFAHGLLCDIVFKLGFNIGYMVAKIGYKLELFSTE